MTSTHAPRDLDALVFREAAESVLRLGVGLALGPLLMGGSLWRSERYEAAVVWTSVTIAVTLAGLVAAWCGRRQPDQRRWRVASAVCAGLSSGCWGSAAFLVDVRTAPGAVAFVLPPIAVIAMITVIFVPFRPSLVAGVLGVSVPFGIACAHVGRAVTVEALPGFLTVTAVFTVQAMSRCRRRREEIVDRLTDAEQADALRRDRADALATNAQLRAVNEQVRRLAERDALTGAYNRRVLLARIGAVPAEDRPRHTLVLVDLDHFKATNDRYGHAMGDEILCHLTYAAQDLLGDVGCFTRWGGEEFAFLLAERDGERVTALVQALRTALRHRLPHGVHSDFSAGAAGWEAGLLTTDLLRRADAALYAAKEGGRGRTEIFRVTTSVPAPSDAAAPG